MKAISKFPAALIIAVFLISGLAACSGGSEMENKLVKAMAEIDSDWALYEVKEKGNRLTIKIEVSDVVPFKDAKKAVEAVIAINPQATGMMEWYNSEVGMTLRKMEIMPTT